MENSKPKHTMRGLETDMGRNMGQGQTEAKSGANRCNEQTRSAGKTQTKYTNTNDKTRNR